MRQTDSYDRTLNPQNCSISSLVSKVAADLNSQFSIKQLTLDNQLPEDLMINLDETQIGHVLQNVFTNACEFSHRCGLTTVAAESSEKVLLIRISDQGLGFTKAQAATLFSPFTAGQTGTAGEQSTSIGLYLSKKIMELHGGAILAESPGAGKGATYTLVFPLATG